MAKKRRSSQFKDTSQVIDIEEARRKRQEKRQKQQSRSRQQEENAQKRAAVKSRVKAGRKRKHITYAVVILCIIAAIGLSAINIISLKAEYKEAEQQKQVLMQQKEEMEQQLKDSSKDKYIEEEARQQLRMVKPGETVFIVPNQQDTQSSSADKENEKE